MFTDIEGSTRLHQRLGDGFAALMRVHDELLTGVINGHGGVVVKSMGDGLFAAFGDAVAAVRAAAEVQRAVRARRWPDGVEVFVRVGLHRGEATPAAGDYVALSVHQAARVSAAAYGGQVLASADVVGAVPTPPLGGWHELGAYRLKDFDEPATLSMLVVPGAEFAGEGARATPAAAHNVPALRTSFLGRAAELADIALVLRDGARLLTVLGPGGVGKTRLVFELAKNLSSSYADGAWVVLLANARENDVAERLLKTLRVPQRAGVPPAQTLLDVLTPRQCLLVLDNCEQIASEVADVVAVVLDSCPGVTVLTTSREPLRLPDEVEWRLTPLSVTDHAAELFIHRATARNPKLSFNDTDRDLIEAVCRAVDGLPLAVELAAGRLRHMPLRQLAEGLQDRLRILQTADRTVEDRQRTLYDLVEWSYSLLHSGAQRLLRQLSVFRAPMRLDAIEAVAGDGLDVAEVLSDLVDKSLVALTADDERPYRMLVVIRGFAALKLREADESGDAQSRHAVWHVRLAEQIGIGCETSEAAKWAVAADAAYDDLSAAMVYLEEVGHGDDLARVASGLFQYFSMRGLISDGRRRLQKAADLAVDPVLSADVRSRAGTFTAYQGDAEVARQMCEAALSQAIDLCETELVATVKGRLAHVCCVQGDLDAAARHASAASRSGVPRVQANALNVLGAVDFFRGDLIQAEEHYRASYDVAATHGLVQAIAVAQMNLGELLVRRGDYVEAESLLLKAVAVQRETLRAQLHLCCEYLSQLYEATGDGSQAEEWRRRALAGAIEVGDVEAQRRLGPQAVRSA